MAKKPGCQFCFPKPEQQPEPPVEQPVVQPPVPEQNLPVAEQTVLEKLPEPEPELTELTAITALAMAFRRANRDSR
jgi:hypothetical protein